MPKVRIAVIGAGEAGKVHAWGYRTARALYHPDLPEVQLVAAVDADRKLAEGLGSRFEFDRVETDWEAVAEAKDIDAVSVAIPNFEHLEVVMGMLGAGKHVMCEKPLAVNATEAFQLSNEADTQGVIHQVGFNFRHTPAVAAIRGLVREGRLGLPMQIFTQYLSDHGRDPAIPFSWRHDISLAGGGSLFDLGSHIVDGARMICGEISAIRGAIMQTHVPERAITVTATNELQSRSKAVTTDDMAVFVARFANECVGMFSTSRVATGIKNSIGFNVVGTDGAARFDWERLGEFGLSLGDADKFTEGFTTVLVGPQHPFLDALILPEAGAGHGIAETFIFKMRDFVMAVATGVPNPDIADFQDGYANSLVLDAVKLSAASDGVEISIDDIRAKVEAKN